MTSDQLEKRKDRIQRILRNRLPEEIILPSSWRRALAPVILSAVILFSINVVAGRYLAHYTPNRGYWLVQEKWRKLEELNEPVEWLILGDSSANQSVVPSVLEEQLGGKAVNLATNAGITLLGDVWMLEEYIERYGTPENVVVVHSIDVWHRDVNQAMIAKIPRTLGFWRRSAVDPGLSPAEWLRIMLVRYAPIVGENQSTMAVVVEALTSPDRLFTTRYHLDADGYMAGTYTDKISTKEETERLIARYGREPFTISSINQASLDQMIALAELHEFDLYLANGPVYERLLLNNTANEHLGVLVRTLQEIVDRSEYVHYLPSMVDFPLEQMEDVDHVIHAAAEVYSQNLASEIERIQPDSEPAESPK